MRAVIQRVARASVVVEGKVVGEIGRGLVILLGAGQGDDESDLGYIASKSVNLRIFPDDAGKMNRSVLDVGGGVLAISQFTLYGDARKGRRPSFITAMEPKAADALYQKFLTALGEAGVARVEAGIFAADMKLELLNDGPVTILLDSKKAF